MAGLIAGIVVAVMLVLLFLALAVHIVQQYEKGVVFRFGRVVGEKNPGLEIEKNKTAKADLVKALKDAVAYCNRAHDGMTDATATQTVKVMGGDQAKLTVLSFNNVHTIEHYGNIITYLRLKGIVPPSSEPRK